MSSINVGFVGPYSDPNLGDYGMLVNNLLDLAGHLGQVKIFTYDEPFIEKLCSDYFPELQADICTVTLGEALEESVISGAVLSPIEILDGILNYQEVFKQVLSLDILVVNGGGYFNELWCQPHRISKTIQILAPILIADDLGIPLIFTGNSYGPFGPRSAFLTSILSSLRNAVFHSRDRVGSIPELRKIGIGEEKISFVPDDLFILNKTLTNTTSEHTDPYIAFEIYQPLDQMIEEREGFAAFDQEMKARGISIVILPFYDGRGGGDQARWLSEEFGWIETKLERGYLPLEVAHRVISNAQFVVCERYHAMVLALASGTPVLHSLRDVMGDKWYYYRKNFGILDTALEGLPFQQKTFMELDPYRAMKRISSDLEKLRDEQINLFDLGLNENIEKSKTTREKMLNLVINGKG